MSQPAVDSLGFQIADVARLLRRRYERALAQAQLGVTPGEARALAHAARSPGLRQAALAERMSVEPMTLVAYLDRLESAGLVARTPDPSDARAKLVRPTQAAEPVVARILKLGRAVREDACQDLEADEVAALRQALVQIRARLMARDRESGASA